MLRYSYGTMEAQQKVSHSDNTLQFGSSLSQYSKVCRHGVSAISSINRPSLDFILIPSQHSAPCEYYLSSRVAHMGGGFSSRYSPLYGLVDNAACVKISPSKRGWMTRGMRTSQQWSHSQREIQQWEPISQVSRILEPPSVPYASRLPRRRLVEYACEWYGYRS
jgi:hypothetical protein